MIFLMGEMEGNLIMNDVSSWSKINIIREKDRPTIKDYIHLIFDMYYEFHGDRYFGDDLAITGGIAKLDGMPVTIISNVKGKNIEENKQSNFGMAHPEGYRKALRLAKQAEKFKRPIICFIDTPGAFCGVEAEQRGQGEAIARNIMSFFNLKTPIISVVLGEGGSGGALALGVCDRLAMLENTVYSVISPRGCATILWKDSSKEKKAADIMKITAEDLISFKIADDIIKESSGGAHKDPEETAYNLKEYLNKTISELLEKDIETLLINRYNKFRKIGEFFEDKSSL